ncbi:Golgi transport complex subunit 5-domain-containing protein [Pilobolus umbonatus]|nr:Golgi transport complex subunit 5-domain-containing protein [Pilobolus umbonatus]
MSSRRFSINSADKYIDYTTFLSDDFDALTYASSIIKNSTSTGDESDIATAITTLSYGIEILTKQIQEQVASHYEVLLKQVTGIKDLEIILNSIQSDINKLNEELYNMSTKIRDPYEQLKKHVVELENLQITCDLLRRLNRFLLLRKRLETQLPEGSMERDNATAALTVYELDTIIKEGFLDGIDLYTSEIHFIKQAQIALRGEAHRLLSEGIESHNQSKMAAGLQIYYNMKEMGDTVYDIVNNMLQGLNVEMKQLANIQIEMKQNIPNGRRVNDPAISTQWTQTIWERMEVLMTHMSDQCIKIYNLEKVLEIKKDSLTQISFLEEASKALDATSLISYFWRVLSMNFEQELKDATKQSSFLHNTLTNDYPRLLKLLRDFFSRLAIHHGSSSFDYSQSPEYVIMLRSFSTFEAGFLTKSSQRISDAVNSAFSSYSGLSRLPPTKNYVLNITRLIGHELELVSFEPQLSQLIARNVTKALNIFCSKCNSLLPSDQPIYSPNSGNTMVNHYLNMNIEAANMLYYMHQSIWKILDEYPEKIVDIIRKGANDLQSLMMKIGSRMVNSIKNDAEKVLMKIHKEDFYGQIRRNFDMDDSGSSGYMKELAAHVRYYHTKILQNFSCGAEPKTWTKEISKYILHVFIFQASMIRPLSESGKLKLAGDMAELEFTISQFLSEYGVRLEEVGDEYKALRAFRPLLFLDSSQLTAAHHTSGLSSLVLIHHLIVRSSQTLPLPHMVYDLTREEYMKWMDRQSDKEAVQLALDAISMGSQLTADELSNIPEYKLILEIASKEP